ncbi:hypothetical protein SynA1528_02109 [Synechococcus sp. A15-28]|nr:hypothetical protein SynA1528_02109 [Synechococcus sp. A15-28]
MDWDLTRIQSIAVDFFGVPSGVPKVTFKKKRPPALAENRWYN